MRSKTMLLIVALAAFVVARPPAASAVPIIGHFSIVGNVSLTSMVTSFPDLMPGTNMIVGSGGTGDFGPLGGTAGTLLNLDKTVDPVGVPISLSGFVTFAADPNIRLDLTFISPGVGGLADCASAPAVGQSCTPPGSEFTFINLPGGSVATFAVSGTATNVATMEQSLFSGGFSLQFTVPFQSVLATLAGGGTLQSTYSASFSVIPEPGTLLLLGSGIAGLVLFGRTKRG